VSHYRSFWRLFSFQPTFWVILYTNRLGELNEVRIFEARKYSIQGCSISLELHFVEAFFERLGELPGNEFIGILSLHVWRSLCPDADVKSSTWPSVDDWLGMSPGDISLSGDNGRLCPKNHQLCLPSSQLYTNFEKFEFYESHFEFEKKPNSTSWKQTDQIT